MEKKAIECQVDEALDIIVGKWKPIILLLLFEHKVMRLMN